MTTTEQELFQKIIRNIDDGIIVVDKDMCVFYCNRWIEQRSNISQDSVIGTALTELFPEIENSRLSNAIKDTLENFTPQFLSNLFHSQPITLYPAVSAFGAGKTSPLQLDINTIPFKLNSSTACIIQIRDVSFSSRRESALEQEILNRSIIERSLRESESRYRLLAENTSDIIIKTDDKLFINYISPNCLYHLGHTDIELHNKNIINQTHENDVENIKSILQYNFSDTASLSLRHRIKNTKGVYEWFESSVRSYTSETVPKKGFILVTRNITERKKEEENRIEMQLQLDKNQRMQSIGHLTGGIAHEFNNILTSIMGYSELSYALPSPINTDTLHKYLDEINKSSQRSKDLVVQLLEYSQEQHIQLKPLDIYTTVEKAIVLIRATLPSAVEVELDIQTGLSKIVTNKVQLEQILLNLCVNAMDAMDKQGTIHIKLTQSDCALTTCQSCHEQFSGMYISIDIKDTGPGINSDELESIFQPFFTSKGRAEATGLGLSVVHGIVHSQGGHILVDSGVNGSTFRILLPINN